MERKNTWELYDKKQLKELEKLNKEYRQFWMPVKRKENVLM